MYCIYLFILIYNYITIYDIAIFPYCYISTPRAGQCCCSSPKKALSVHATVLPKLPGDLTRGYGWGVLDVVSGWGLSVRGLAVESNQALTSENCQAQPQIQQIRYVEFVQCSPSTPTTVVEPPPEAREQSEKLTAYALRPMRMGVILRGWATWHPKWAWPRIRPSHPTTHPSPPPPSPAHPPPTARAYRHPSNRAPRASAGRAPARTRTPAPVHARARAPASEGARKPVDPHLQPCLPAHTCAQSLTNYQAL